MCDIKKEEYANEKKGRKWEEGRQCQGSKKREEKKRN